jgi:hypothetical protein
VAGNLGTDKDVEALARAARKAGWRVGIDGANHLRWQGPDGREFRSPLTGGPSVPLRVRRKLASLDPATFGSSLQPAEPRPAPDVAAEVEAATSELEDLIDLLRALARDADAETAADLIRDARAVLRACEDALRLGVRSSRAARSEG